MRINLTYNVKIARDNATCVRTSNDIFSIKAMIVSLRLHYSNCNKKFDFTLKFIVMKKASIDHFLIREPPKL